jgi:hypothetical protein
MLAKMPEETSKIILHPLWHAIMTETLKTTTQAWLGDKLLTTESSYILSLAGAYHVAPGAQAQGELLGEGSRESFPRRSRADSSPL